MIGFYFNCARRLDEFAHYKTRLPIAHRPIGNSKTLGDILHRFFINEVASQCFVSTMICMHWAQKVTGEIDSVHVSLRTKVSSN